MIHHWWSEDPPSGGTRAGPYHVTIRDSHYAMLGIVLAIVPTMNSEYKTVSQLCCEAYLAGDMAAVRHYMGARFGRDLLPSIEDDASPASERTMVSALTGDDTIG